MFYIRGVGVFEVFPKNNDEYLKLNVYILVVINHKMQQLNTLDNFCISPSTYSILHDKFFFFSTYNRTENDRAGTYYEKTVISPSLFYINDDSVIQHLSRITNKDELIQFLRQLVKSIYINPIHRENMMIIPFLDNINRFHVYISDNWTIVNKPDLVLYLYFVVSNIMSEYKHNYIYYSESISESVQNIIDTYIFNEDNSKKMFSSVASIFNEEESIRVLYENN